ncbi:MAG: Mrp/NBP35 family ATP-binding protein [Parvibaculaceae bacterium]
MEKITREPILAALAKLRLPGGSQDIVSAGLISDIVVANNRVMFAITADQANTAAMELLRREAERIVAGLPGVEKVMVALTAERKPAPPKTANLKSGIPGLRHIVAVASGKGGVGKSTMAVNLALALKANGLRVAVLDADVYGPSLPKLLGITGKPRAADAQGKLMQPMEAFGLKVMSMGFLVPEDTPMIWRGPMVMSALMQMLRDVTWGDIDVMIVDMPPGTGDAQLTLAQQTPLSGAVIVSTPQDLALLDARKGLNMFRKVSVPVLGIIENMSYFICGKCGERHEIFGHGGAREEARRLGVPFLGEVPLDMEVRARSDAGEPIVAALPEGVHAMIFRRMAEAVWSGIEAGSVRKSPRIVIEE